MLDKYIGDAMMALFNTPLSVADHPDRAVASALGIVACLETINAGFDALKLPRIDVGVGVNTGPCIVGNMGSKVRFEYTAIGDAVKSRLAPGGPVQGLPGPGGGQRIHPRPPPGAVPVASSRPGAGQGEGAAGGDLRRPWPTSRPTGSARRPSRRPWNATSPPSSRPPGAAFAALAAEVGDPPAEVFRERCRRFTQTPPPPRLGRGLRVADQIGKGEMPAGTSPFFISIFALDAAARIARTGQIGVQVVSQRRHPGVVPIDGQVDPASRSIWSTYSTSPAAKCSRAVCETAL